MQVFGISFHVVPSFFSWGFANSLKLFIIIIIIFVILFWILSNSAFIYMYFYFVLWYPKQCKALKYSLTNLHWDKKLITCLPFSWPNSSHCTVHVQYGIWCFAAYHTVFLCRVYPLLWAWSIHVVMEISRLVFLHVKLFHTSHLTWLKIISVVCRPWS